MCLLLIEVVISVTVGACCGRILGILVQWFQYSYPSSPVFASCKGDLNCVIPGLYAMVGAAAALSGVTVSLRLRAMPRPLAH